MLFTKSIYTKKISEDGLRVSVMSRHTLFDGKTPDTAMNFPESVDEWWQWAAPPQKLVGAWYRREVSKEEFTQHYQMHLQRPKVSFEVKELARRALHKNVTLLCVEPKGEFCHRVLLAEECKKYEPELCVEHR